MLLFIKMGIAATGVAILYIVKLGGQVLSTEVSWLTAGAIPLVPVCISMLQRTIQIPPKYHQLYRIVGNVTVISSFIILLLMFSGSVTIPLLALLILLMLSLVFYGLKVQIELFGPEEKTIT